MRGTVDAFTLGNHVRKIAYQDAPRHTPAVPGTRIYMAGKHDIRRLTSPSFPAYEYVHDNDTVSWLGLKLHMGGEAHHTSCTAVGEERDPL